MRKLLIVFGVVMLIFGVAIYTMNNVTIDYAFVPEAEDIREEEKNKNSFCVSRCGPRNTGAN